MLSKADNELMCRVEPGTPMNEAFKRYWIPAGLSSDLSGPDSDPVRVTLLCENYVMFRDSNGDVAFMRERCCHRGASLCLGRVENGGIRCIFHGWKFDKTGKILDLPNATDERIKEHYRQPAYPAVERGGLIWVYLGPAESKPAVPDYYWMKYPEEKRGISAIVFDCNYMQAVDGGADSSHLTILHQDALSRPLNPSKDDVLKRVLADAAPKFETFETDFGQFSVAIRQVPGPDGELVQSARTSAYIAPSTVLVGGKGYGVAGIAVPVTSEKTIFYFTLFSEDGNQKERDRSLAYQNIDLAAQERLGIGRYSTDRAEKFSVHNNWAQDRAAMKDGNRFTGLPLFIPEDIAVAESMGRIYERDEENLVQADLAIVKIRGLAVSIARDMQAGVAPIGLRNPVDTSAIFTNEMFLEKGADWRETALPEPFRPKAKAGAKVDA